MSDIILETVKLSKTFSTGGIQHHVLKNLDLAVYRGDFTVIMGPSGAGKSTLLYAMSGMDKPTLGQVVFNGQDISKLNNDQLALFRRHNCGFVFQQIYLIDNMSVMDNVLASGFLVQKDKKALANRARQLFEQVGLGPELWQKFPNQLSGGEAQRAGIVRALVNSPVIVFADEPTGSLNSVAGTDVLDMLTQVNQEGLSVVMVTHDLKSAVRGSRIVYLRDGVICGECVLGAYGGGDGGDRLGSDHAGPDSAVAVSGGSGSDSEQSRQARLQGFLTEMGW